MAHPQPGDRITLPVAKLLPCPAQPPHRPDQVDALVENWRAGPEYLTALRVYRRDGQWWIRNGQHRWLAAHRLGVAELPCHVADGPSRAWHRVDLHWWRVEDGRPVDPRPACTCPACERYRARVKRTPPRRGWYPAVVRPLDSEDNPLAS